MLGFLMSPFARLIFKGFAATVFAAPGFSFGSPATTQADFLGVGDHFCSLNVGGLNRTYLVHVPRGYDPTKPEAVVLALHGAAMTGSMMVWFSGLNVTSEKNNFIVLYPNGTGFGPLGVLPEASHEVTTTMKTALPQWFRCRLICTGASKATNTK